MNRRSIAVTCRQRIVELTHPQGTPLDIVLSLGPGMAITESTVFRADLQTARFPASAPLARTADVTAAPGATGPWTLALTGAQLNQTVTGESRRFWLPVYGVVGGTRIEPLVGIVLTLTANNISSLAPPPPVEPIYLTEASASDLYAALADFDALEGRVTSLESQEGGGGAQADWNATTGPSEILNKPTLGNSASRNVGTGAGDVATGNHTHSSTSQVAGLDTALAGKADLSGGKLLVSQLPDLAITQWLGSVANQSAMLALVGQRGDWCVRTDDGKVYIVTAEPSSILGNWTSLAYPNAPVLSVAGRTGSITLGVGDIASLQNILDFKVNSDSLYALAFRDTVNTAQIENDAVSTLKIANASVTAEKLAAGAVPPAGTGTELQCRNGTAFGAVAGSSVSGANVTLTGSLAINSGSATNGLRLTGAGGLAQIFFYGTGANGFFYPVDTTGVAFRGKSFMLQGDGAAETCQLIIGVSTPFRLRTGGTNNMCLGDADAASPLPQTISVQSATGTHVSAASAVFSLDGARGRGTGVGGDVRIRVSQAGSTSGVLNPLVEAVRFRATDLATVCAGPIIAGGPLVYASFTNSTLPSVTLWSRGQIWVSEAGGGYPAFSDGTNWLRYSDNSIVTPS